ncbi:MAG: universal stress protein [Desulfobacterales bacterium]
MEPIENILACLDLTEIDDYVISYAAHTAEIFRAQSATFVHVIQAYDLPDRRSKSFPDVKSSLNSMIQEELDERIDPAFRQKVKTEVAIRVAEVNAADEILSFVRETNTDLMLLGQKHGEDREGRYGRRVAAESGCDIVFVPENPPDGVSAILCAIDYSSSSTGAFDRALHLQQTLGASVTCYYIQDVTKTYFPVSTSKSASRSQSRAEAKHRQLIESFGLNPDDYPCRIDTTDQLASEAEKICRIADEEKADLVIVGAQGDTASETSLLGNVSETLRRMEKYTPVMIVKHVQDKKFFSEIIGRVTTS